MKYFTAFCKPLHFTVFKHSKMKLTLCLAFPLPIIIYLLIISIFLFCRPFSFYPSLSFEVVPFLCISNLTPKQKAKLPINIKNNHTRFQYIEFASNIHIKSLFQNFNPAAIANKSNST